MSGRVPYSLRKVGQLEENEGKKWIWKKMTGRENRGIHLYWFTYGTVWLSTLLYLERIVWSLTTLINKFKVCLALMAFFVVSELVWMIITSHLKTYMVNLGQISTDQQKKRNATSFSPSQQHVKNIGLLVQRVRNVTNGDCYFANTN